jgi:hypothetical protein
MRALLRWCVLLLVISSISQATKTYSPTNQTTKSSSSTSSFSASSWIPSPECPHEPLPLSLDSLMGLGLMGEMHDWNQYYVGAEYHAISFSLANASSFSMYLESAMSVELWITDSSNIYRAVCQVNQISFFFVWRY